MYYVGVRCKDCNPNDLWIKYFTSSKTIHKLIELYGKDFNLKLLKYLWNSRRSNISRTTNKRR